jgi:hypothetical protein
MSDFRRTEEQIENIVINGNYQRIHKKDPNNREVYIPAVARHLKGPQGTTVKYNITFSEEDSAKRYYLQDIKDMYKTGDIVIKGGKSRRRRRRNRSTKRRQRKSCKMFSFI